MDLYRDGWMDPYRNEESILYRGPSLRDGSLYRWISIDMRGWITTEVMSREMGGSIL